MPTVNVQNSETDCGAMAAAMAEAEGCDRAAALKSFDETKAGVRGLMESGVTTLPPIFRRPTAAAAAAIPVRTDLSIPTIDLSLPETLATHLVHSAAADWGVFQVINHGIPLHVISSAISSARAFHELPAADRSRYYSHDAAAAIGGVLYLSNFDLFRSGSASWRDTLQVPMWPIRPDTDRMPEVCRAELLAWDEHAKELARRLMGMLSEGIGVRKGRLEEMSCLEGRTIVCHYYPPCPEPDETEGMADHTDPGVLAVLIEDEIGGLQVKKRTEGGEVFWVDVKPVPGAITVNVGDLLQIISNDAYKSVEHRVLANSHEDARLSVAIFYKPGNRADSDFYGPLPELVSLENPPHYRNFPVMEFLNACLSKHLSSKFLLEQFKSV